VATTITFMTVIAIGATPAPAEPDIAPPGAATGYTIASDVMMEEVRRATRHERIAAEQALERSANPQDRERAALALAFSSGRDVIPALLDALHDVDSQVREKAAIGLALRRDGRVVEPLIAAMTDSDSQVREKVAIALGSSGDPRAKDVLTQALDDPDEQVREKATTGLVLLGLTPR
jgi:HEAT repeat protein